MEERIKNELNRLPEGLLKDYTSFIINHTPTSYEWAEANALTLLSLSASMNKFVYTKMGPINMHTYFLNCGPSRLAYKSLPIRNFTRPIIRKLSFLTKKDLLAPKRFTVESMLDWVTSKPEDYKPGRKAGKKSKTRLNQNNTIISDNNNGLDKDEIINNITRGERVKLPVWSDEGAMMYDEFSTIFKDSKSKSFASDILEFLSELDDGYVEKRQTITHGTQGGVDVFFSILAATTPDFFQSIDKGFFRQGTGNKFFYIMSEPQKLQREYPEDDDLEALNFFGLMSGLTVRDMKDQLSDFAQRLYNLRTKAPPVLEFTPTAAKLAFHYYDENHSIASAKWFKDWKDIRYSFYSQRSVSMMKLAGLYTLSKNENKILSDQITKDDGVLIITESAIKWAIGRMDVYTGEFNKLLDLWPQAVSHEETYKTQDAYYNAIEAILKQHNGLLTKQELQSQSGLSSRKFGDIINDMIKTGKIYRDQVEEQQIEVSSKGGRKPIIYSLLPPITVVDE